MNSTLGSVEPLAMFISYNIHIRRGSLLLARSQTPTIRCSSGKKHHHQSIFHLISTSLKIIVFKSSFFLIYRSTPLLLQYDLLQPVTANHPFEQSWPFIYLLSFIIYSLQLFTASHPFEQYDLYFRDKFGFEVNIANIANTLLFWREESGDHFHFHTLFQKWLPVRFFGIGCKLL